MSVLVWRSINHIAGDSLLCFGNVAIILASLVVGSVLALLAEATQLRDDWISNVITSLIITSGLLLVILIRRINASSVMSWRRIGFAEFFAILSVASLAAVLHVGIGFTYATALVWSGFHLGIVFYMIVALCGLLGFVVGVVGAVECNAEKAN